MSNTLKLIGKNIFGKYIFAKEKRKSKNNHIFQQYWIHIVVD